METEVLERSWENQDDQQRIFSPGRVEMHEGNEVKNSVDCIKLEKVAKLREE